MAARIRRLGAVALLAATAACGGSGQAGEIPSEEAARAYLDQLVAMAGTHDLGAFCQLAGGGNCDDIADLRGSEDAIPAEPPFIAGTRLIPTRTENGDAIEAGGRLFVVCGTDGLGRGYRTELLVSTDFDGSLYAINAVYWSGFGLAVSHDTGSPSGGDGINCPAT